MPGKHAPNKRCLGIRIDKDIAARFTEYARRNGMTTTALLVRYITKCAYKIKDSPQDVEPER